MQYAKDTYLELGPRRAVAANGALARLLDCAPGRRWLKFTGLRRSEEGGAPICTTDLYVDPAYGRIARRLGRDRQAVHQLIEQLYGVRVAEVRQQIAAVRVAAEAAETLGTEPGAPALRIVRNYVGTTGKVFEASVSIHPADRFSYAMRIRRDGVG